MVGRPTRPGFGTITPYLVVRQVDPYLSFLTAAFGATEHFRNLGEAGGVHVELRIGDSMLMVGGGEQSPVPPTPTMLFLYVEDVDAVYHAALAAGATSLMEPGPNMGEPRGAGIKDPVGNDWFFALWTERADAQPAFVEPSDPAKSTVVPMLDYEDGPAAMDWLIQAFGFQEVVRMVTPEGRLDHGELSTGSGRVMLGSVPGYESPKHHRQHCERVQAWSATPWVVDGVLVYVEDVAQHYAQAVRSGAGILTEPEGGWPGRRYRVEDLEGHRWMFLERAV
jgi:PhnB protein